MMLRLFCVCFLCFFLVSKTDADFDVPVLDILMDSMLKDVGSSYDTRFEPYPREMFPICKTILKFIAQSEERTRRLYDSFYTFSFHDKRAVNFIHDKAVFVLLDGDSDPIEDFTTIEDRKRYPVHRSGSLFDEEVELFAEEGQEDSDCLRKMYLKPLTRTSAKGIPGEHYPNYKEIPDTGFSCVGKRIPGFYADLQTGCQVFHVCWPDRKESFLCPVGTIFNQAILACDYWYTSNCSLAPVFYNSNPLMFDEILSGNRKPITDPSIAKRACPHVTPRPTSKLRVSNVDWTIMVRFLPIKSKISVYPKPADRSVLKQTPKRIPYQPTSEDEDFSELCSLLHDVLEAADKLEGVIRTVFDKIKVKKICKYTTNDVNRRDAERDIRSEVDQKVTVSKKYTEKLRKQELPEKSRIPLRNVKDKFIVKPASIAEFSYYTTVPPKPSNLSPLKNKVCSKDCPSEVTKLLKNIVKQFIKMLKDHDADY
ncbi:uncharacterized protein CEXT_255321 [Caerostris extrusa]|uniref:Chitin-binding type-2 domain-containing protein n=1 Tax=Caerostris extrusa TaxID=172846 RepID=A0AAV4PEH0_CAEEX|nr:uncharacterized protein CEXT_255321 [Caerostris extrusa]